MIPNRDFEGIDYREAGGGVRFTDLRGNKPMNIQNLIGAANGEKFTPERDVIKKLNDGRQIQVAVAGTPMLVAEARELGLIDENGKTLDKDGVILESDETAQTEEAEEKAKTPANNKAKAPKENK